MNYEYQYQQLISTRSALQEVREFRKKKGAYFERHHIVPKCTGGSDEPANLILLTAREHLIAHLLLWKWHGGKLFYAVWYMTNIKQRKGLSLPKLSSRVYETLRIEQCARNKRTGPDHWNYGRKHTKETKHKMSLAKQGQPSPRKGVQLTEATKEKIQLANIGKSLSQETKHKISTSIKNSNHPMVKITEPFQHVKYTNDATLRFNWIRLDEIYALWKEKELGFIKLSRLLYTNEKEQMRYRYQIRRIIDWFRDNGDPSNSITWKQWKQQYTKETKI